MRLAVVFALCVGCAGAVPESKQSNDESGAMRQALADQSRQLAALDEKVTALDQKLGAAKPTEATKPSDVGKPLEPPKPLVEAPKPTDATGWSCAARCVTSYKCTTNGKNNVSWKNIASHASTAAAAWKQLVDKCDDAPFVSGQCKDGTFVFQDATIVNACVRE